jgi:hypothetical protein
MLQVSGTEFALFLFPSLEHNLTLVKRKHSLITLLAFGNVHQSCLV